MRIACLRARPPRGPRVALPGTLLYLLLALCPATSHGHLSGFTDTSIQIAQPGLKLVYTLPADNLLELAEPIPNARSPSRPAPPEAYLAAVTDGWRVYARKRNCSLVNAQSKRLDGIDSYQYVLRYRCPQGLDDLDIRYRLFIEQARGHQNFTRIFMTGERMRMRFAFDRNRLAIPVEDLLRQWGRQLGPDFLGEDPNQGYDPDRAEADATARPSSSLANQDGWSGWSGVAGRYIELGVEHILLGADHLLFLLGLLLIARGPWVLAKTITAFTLAHSLSLGVAVLGLVDVPPQPVEAIIALSILFLVWEIVRAQHGKPGLSHRRPWLIASAFGLLHGLGFSGALTVMGLAPDEIPTALLFFNLGVEIGQLMFVFAFLLLRASWRQLEIRWPPAFDLVPVYLIGAVAGYWLVLRIDTMI